MFKSIWTKGWWNIPHDFNREGLRFRQVQLLQTVLLLLQFYFGLFVILNIVSFDRFLMAFVDAIAFIGITIIQLMLRRSLSLENASKAVIALISIFLVAHVHINKGADYSFIWLTCLPPLAYFLLGSKSATRITIAFFVYIFGYLILDPPTWQSSFDAKSFANILLAVIMFVLLIRHYEDARIEAHQILESKNQQLIKLATIDPLTGLFNRSHLDAALEREFARAKRDKNPLAVMIIDADNFKLFNDGFGHLIGDQVLVEAGQLMSQLLRKTDVLARWGGEEFLIVAPNTDASGALDLAEKIRVAIAENKFSDEGLHLTMSIGVAVYSPDDSIVSLIQRADDGLYQAKDDGRNCTRMGIAKLGH